MPVARDLRILVNHANVASELYSDGEEAVIEFKTATEAYAFIGHIIDLQNRYSEI